MAWRLAKGLQRLLEEVNTSAPGRSKSSDGTIGDTAHASRPSDHNPDSRGIVHALDITNDPLHGVVSQKLAEDLRASEDDRIKYIISNRRIWNPSVSPEWRAYTGSNPHDKHVHISITQLGEDNVRDWAAVPTAVGPHVVDQNAPEVRPLMKLGSADVENIQLLWRLLATQEPKVFGPILEAGIKAFQRKKGLAEDGRVGSYTWGALTGE